MPTNEKPLRLLTGATGYVGGELLKTLQRAGSRVRCLARSPEKMADKADWGIEVVQGDVLEPDTLAAALRDVDTAYYLIHSMSAAGEFESLDRLAAANFGAAAREAGVRRIIYLGGLGDDTPSLSTHLRSRQEVGEILRRSGVQVIEFRSSIVIGSGSFSFEMIRALAERLPVMVTPKWVATPAQPIAISDLLAYLLEALDLEIEGNPIFEIGGAERTSYGGLMREYCRQRGLRRFLIPVPVLTPHLSSLWLALVTPYHARIGRKLIEGLQNPTVLNNPTAAGPFRVRPLGLADSISQALAAEDAEFARGFHLEPADPGSTREGWTGRRVGNRFVESRSAYVPKPPQAAFAPIARIGGRTGWYYGDWLWRLRGLLDRLIGGVGMRRGCHDAKKLAVGEALDFWRVEALEPSRRLRLAAEIKLPGRAWLEFCVEPSDNGSQIRQTAVFDPLGLSGLAYWYLALPLHYLLFSGLLRGIQRAAAAEGRPGADAGWRK